jgi:hypothetical protein
MHHKPVEYGRKIPVSPLTVSLFQVPKSEGHRTNSEKRARGKTHKCSSFVSIIFHSSPNWSPVLGRLNVLSPPHFNSYNPKNPRITQLAVYVQPCHTLLWSSYEHIHDSLRYINEPKQMTKNTACRCSARPILKTCPRPTLHLCTGTCLQNVDPRPPYITYLIDAWLRLVDWVPFLQHTHTVFQGNANSSCN